MKKITPFLWYDGKAEEAAKFYTSIFKNSRVQNIRPGPQGSVMGVEFQLEGQDFIALNGGPHFTFSPAISFFVSCKTQDEVDELWDKLSAGGEKQPCGWLKDKYGVSWQVYPPMLDKIFAGKDKAKAERVMKAMLGMVKLDIPALQAAAK
jgi:predicted 3-demethylubiquinone-9 3-methyltransferase (glyoxalase superfamily)